MSQLRLWFLAAASFSGSMGPPCGSLHALLVPASCGTQLSPWGPNDCIADKAQSQKSGLSLVPLIKREKDPPKNPQQTFPQVLMDRIAMDGPSYLIPAENGGVTRIGQDLPVGLDHPLPPLVPGSQT